MSVRKVKVLRLASGIEDTAAFRDFLDLTASTVPERDIADALGGLLDFMQGRGISPRLGRDSILFAREVIGHHSPEHALRFALELNRNDGFGFHVRRERLILSILNTHKRLSGEILRRVRPVSVGELMDVRVEAESEDDFLAEALESDHVNVRYRLPGQPAVTPVEEAVPQPPHAAEEVEAFMPIDPTVYRVPEFMALADVSVSAQPTGICHDVFRPAMSYLYEPSDLFHHFRIFGRTPQRQVGEVLPVGVVLPRYGMTDNYYHALIDRVAALFFASLTGRRMPVLSSFALGPFERRLCRLLRIPTGNIIVAEGLSHVVRRGLMPHMPSVRHRFYRHCQNLARARLARRKRHPPRRIYISRRAASARRLLNEEAVERRARAAGFRVVHFEKMPVEEQMVAMAGAEVVLAPHGAGLANLVFCRPGTRVVELLSEDYPNGSFRQLAHDCGLRHTLVLGESRDGDTWEMPLSRLDAVLDQLVPQEREPSSPDVVERSDAHDAGHEG